MDVKELKAILAELPEEMEVVVADTEASDEGFAYGIEKHVIVRNTLILSMGFGTEI